MNQERKQLSIRAKSKGFSERQTLPGWMDWDLGRRPLIGWCDRSIFMKRAGRMSRNGGASLHANGFLHVPWASFEFGDPNAS